MTDDGSSRLPLHEAHEKAGAFFADFAGARIPRHYGDPRHEYSAATEGLGVKDRSYRARLRVSGRSPVQMLQGVISNSVPLPPAPSHESVLSGEGAYSAILTVKGKMITDLKLFWLGAEESEGLLLDLPPEGVAATTDYFKRSLPPRFAVVEDLSASLGMITVMGPRASDVVSEEVLDSRVEGPELEGMAGNAYCLVGEGEGETLHVIREGDVAPTAFDVVAPIAALREVWGRLVGKGAVPVGQGVWETLRLEKGRPAFGLDMDETTIPMEAGIQGRAIDHEKGCYTGQEVIVRIRDRGHVNWQLRGLRLGDAPSPSVGTELFREGEEKAVGRITRAAHSPAFRETIALGYVRSEVEMPGELRLGNPQGTLVRAQELNDDGW